MKAEKKMEQSCWETPQPSRFINQIKRIHLAGKCHSLVSLLLFNCMKNYLQNWLRNNILIFPCCRCIQSAKLPFGLIGVTVTSGEHEYFLM